MEEENYPILTGRAWVFADFLRAAEIVPPSVATPAEGGRALFRDLDPALVWKISPGDFLVGGSELGCGEGGSMAARALRSAGIAAAIARSFAGEFAVEALAIGLPAVTIDETQMIKTGDRLRLDLEGRKLANLSSGDRYPIRELSEEMLERLRGLRQSS